MHSSPKHYDKFTYSTRRRPEGDSPGGTYGPHSSMSPSRNPRPPISDYEACIAGLAPLSPDSKEAGGFCVTEDGRISSRMVSPARFGAPSIALIQVPVTITATTARHNNGASGSFTSTMLASSSPVTTNTTSTRSQLSPSPSSALKVRKANASTTTPTKQSIAAHHARQHSTPNNTAASYLPLSSSPSGLIPRGSTLNIQTIVSPPSWDSNRSSVGGSSIMSPYHQQSQSSGGGTAEWVAWDKLVSLAANEFREEELVNLSWAALSDLCKYYQVTNPVDVARIQLAYKKKAAVDSLASVGNDDRRSTLPLGGEGVAGARYSADTTVYIPTAAQHNINLAESGLIRRPSFSNVLAASGYEGGSPSSPRRGVHDAAFVPAHKSPMRWRSPAKVDTGLVKPIGQRDITPPLRSNSFADQGSSFRSTPKRGMTPTRSTPKRVFS